MCSIHDHIRTFSHTRQPVLGNRLGPRPVLVGTSLGPVGFAFAALALDPGADTLSLAAGVALLVGTGAWLTGRGYAWARWSLTALFGGVGVLALAAVLGPAPFSAWGAGEWAALTCGVLLLAGAGGLFASDALDELSARRAMSRHPESWEDVGRTPRAQTGPPPVSGDRSALDRRRFWGRLAGMLATWSTALMWVATVVGLIWLWLTSQQAVGIAADGMNTTNPLSGILSLLAFLMIAAIVVAYLTFRWLAWTRAGKRVCVV